MGSLFSSEPSKPREKELPKVNIVPVTIDNYERLFVEVMINADETKWIDPPGEALCRKLFYPSKEAFIIQDAETTEFVGFVMIDTASKYIGPGEILIDRFVIDKDHRGQGYGVAAMNTGARMLLEKYRRDVVVWLETNSDNYSAMKLYTAVGFVFRDDPDPSNIGKEHPVVHGRVELKYIN